MDRSQQIELFVRRFLSLHGSKLRDLEDGVLKVELPSGICQALDVEPKLRLAFSPSAGQKTGSEYITFGHPLLDRMLEMARARGKATSLIFPHGVDREFLEGVYALRLFEPGGRSPHTDGDDPRPAEVRRLERRIGRIRFVGVDVKVLETRVVYHPQVMFFFKVSFLSDEKRERVVPLLIDPYTEEVDRPVDLKGAVFFPVARAGELKHEEYTLQRLYRRACGHLENRLGRTIAEYQRELRKRLKQEEKRIEEYYAGLIQERLEPLRKLFRKMAVASVRADLARSISTENRYREAFAELKEESRKLEAQYAEELSLLEAEKERRIQEVREKHQARMEVALTHAAWVQVPRVEWRLYLTGRVRKETTLLYDILRRRLVDWECESCSRPLADEVHLCECEALVCERCHHTCPGCGRKLCGACTEQSCHVCGGPVCPLCAPRCPAAVEPLRSFSVCAACFQTQCPGCAASVFFHAEGVRS